MVPPDGARTKRIPTLSWDSVVDSPDRPSVDESEVPPHDPPATDAPINLEPLSLDLVRPVDDHVASAVDQPVTIRTTPPTAIVPAIGDVTSGPELLTTAPAVTSSPAAMPSSVSPPAFASPAPPTSGPAAAATSAPSDALPEIQEATPFQEQPTLDEVAPLQEPASLLAHGAPMLPSVPAPAPRPVTSTPFEFDPASVAPVPTRQPRRNQKRRGVKLVATIVVLGALIAAGVVFGQPYLFPSEWDAAAAPYADAVEVGRAVDFNEPVTVVAEPTAEFAARLQSELAPVSADDLLQWRALGLASGAVDDSTLATQLAGWQGALYSAVDGQVYHDREVAGPELEAQLVQALTAASLDQEFGWSVGQVRRTLDAAAATSAEVLRQARLVQQSSPFGASVAPVSGDLDATVPAVVGYRLLAPHVFAEFDTPVRDGTNPLADLGDQGPGMLGRDRSIAAAGAGVLDGGTLTTSPVAKDRSFWYLVFAGYLDPRTAYAASEAVVESALTGGTRGSTQCVSATFSGGGTEQTATLRTALDSWAAAAPVEMASSSQVLPDGTLQLVACDPGAQFVGTARPGVVRELLAWRVAELITMEAVSVGGGGDAEFRDAWAFVQSSPVALDLMSLPPTTSPAELAAAARAGFDSLFTAE